MEIEIPDLDDLKFEDSCRSCYGSGFVRDKKNNNRVSCYNCDGTGMITTVVGERLIEFLRARGLELKPRQKVKA